MSKKNTSAQANKAAKEAPKPSSITTSAESNEISFDTATPAVKPDKKDPASDLNNPIDIDKRGGEQSVSTPKSEEIKEDKKPVVKPKTHKIPVVVKMDEVTDPIVSISSESTNTPPEQPAKKDSNAFKVSFQKKMSGDSANPVAISASSSTLSAISQFNSFVLRNGLKTRQSAENLAKGMLGDSVVIKSGLNPTEIYFEVEGIRVPSSGVYFIR